MPDTHYLTDDPLGWPLDVAAKICPVFRTITGRHLAARIPPDVLEDLRWQVEHPGAVVTMSKPTLSALLDAYLRLHERQAV